MPRTASNVGTTERGRFPGTESYEAVDPLWQPWIDLLDLALHEASDPSWATGLVSIAERPAEAPLLHGSTLRLDARRAGAFAMRLAEASGILAFNGHEATEVIHAAITRDHGSLSRVAERLGVAVDTVAVLSQLCALPLLQGCARQLGADASRAWQRGYCPVCGAWPSLVEMRGIERDRRLRCGCCGGDWPLPVLRCAFCDEVDHRRLGSLLPEGEEQLVRIETCESCRGYLKVVMTLGTLPFGVLARRDLATVALDLAARDRGYTRPSHPAWVPGVELVA